MSTCKSRLLIEVRDSLKNKDDDIELSPSQNNVLYWIAEIKGPKETPYEGGIYKLNITIPIQYPLIPPTPIFETPIFHPNINFNTGEICIDVIKNNWSPAWTLNSLCRAILSILSDPNPNSPLNCDAGNILRSNVHN
ncbi:hypothetical protein FG386_001598 [Cryptosporidium ryanae]|uniref:uncharacterized protein n=1 Tax=Cryptosporidium ryanae TaxID=515981 RepID=UPI00351A0B47|nr:hypothetical protein FG386_001598 [Cryptosporidium ryanae]